MTRAGIATFLACINTREAKGRTVTREANGMTRGNVSERKLVNGNVNTDIAKGNLV